MAGRPSVHILRKYVTMIKNFLLVGLGGAIGSMFRYALALLVKSNGFPLATFLVNVGGSLLIGMVFGLSQRDETFATNWKLFLATGICGGFTTFSTFSAENLQLMQQGRWALCGGYILLSIITCITATWLGYRLVHS